MTFTGFNIKNALLSYSLSCCVPLFVSAPEPAFPSHVRHQKPLCPVISLRVPITTQIITAIKNIILYTVSVSCATSMCLLI